MFELLCQLVLSAIVAFAANSTSAVNRVSVEHAPGEAIPTKSPSQSFPVRYESKSTKSPLTASAAKRHTGLALEADKYMSLGELYESKGCLERARECYEKAFELYDKAGDDCAFEAWDCIDRVEAAMKA